MKSWNFHKNSLSSLKKIKNLCENSKTALNDDPIIFKQILEKYQNNSKQSETQLESIIDDKNKSIIENIDCIEIEPGNTTIFSYFNERIDNSYNFSLDDIHQLKSLNNPDLIHLLNDLKPKFNLSILYNIILLCYESNENIYIIDLIFEQILVPIILEDELSKSDQTILQKLAEINLNKFAKTVIRFVILKPSKNIDMILKFISLIENDTKHFILKHFLEISSELSDEYHMKIITNLYYKELDSSMKKKLLLVLQNSCLNYQTSQLFGRFLLNFVKNIDNKDFLMETNSIIDYILDNHNTSLKIQIVNTLKKMNN